MNEPKILDWLSSLVGYQFEHSYSDRFMSVSVDDGEIKISLDLRNKAQKELFELLPYKGTKQRDTGIMVNLRTLYIPLGDFVSVDYPEIIGWEKIKETKHQSGSGGWIDVGEFFYTYDWEVHLSDGTTIPYHNQSPKMDMVKGDYCYTRRIEERAFNRFIEDVTFPDRLR